METGDQQHPPQHRPPLPAAPEEGSEDRYARLLESLQIGVIVQGKDAQVSFANRAALEMLGLEAEEVVGLSSMAVGELAVHPDGTPFPPEDHPGPRALATGRPVRGVIMGFHHRTLQERVWLLVNADPELNASGEVGRVVCTFVDVTPFKSAEVRLQQSEARYRQLVEKAQDIIYGTDPSGFFTYVNPAASRLMGYPAQELVGRHFTTLVREDHRQRVAARLVQQYQERADTTYDEFPVLPSDGHELWIGQNVQLLSKDGRVEGFQAVARDITERKRAQVALERERQQLRDIVTHAPVAMAILDRDLRYVAHSRKWARLWGVEGQTIVGRSHADVSPRLMGRYAEAIQRALDGQVVTSPEDAVQLADGSMLYTRWTLHPWLDTEGAVAGVVTVVQNVDLLVRARQAAQEASRHKSEFLANVSHELRTPLGQIIAVSALLQQSALDEQQDQWVQHVRDAGGELLDRIDGILHYARLEAEPLELKVEEFDPRALMESVARTFADPAAANGLALSCDLSPDLPESVRGDEARLRQALHQLVGNAVKFTAAGSVQLRLRASGPSEEPVLTFEVEDTGPGIAPEEQARLFQPFTQLDGSASRRYGGTGLGLALAHRLAQAMGGDLSLQSEPGRGSIFTFTARFERVESALEDEAPASPATAFAEASIGAPQPPRVLVAEDNPINRKVVMAMLDKLGYRGDAVGNGLEAVEACARTHYDLVLMDCMMPEMDGYRATAWVRQREAPGKRTPIVALTASTAPGDREKCFAAGMDGYLSKPISLRMLDETLRRWVPALEEEAVRAPAADTSGSRLPADHPLRVLEARGRREAVIEIIDLFLESTPLRLERLREMARDGDLAALLSLAHSLRGAALQLGAREVAALCAEVQAAARENQAAQLDPLFERLQAEFRAVAELLGGERARLAGPE
jgi:PAS domain S-box-containing protein